MHKFEAYEDIYNWLEKQPRDVVKTFAVRAALRAIPDFSFVFDLVDINIRDLASAELLPSFWGLNNALVVGIQNSNFEEYEFRPKEVPFSHENIGLTSINCAIKLFHAPVKDHSELAAKCAFYTTQYSDHNSRKSVLQTLSSDANLVESGRNSRTLACQPLWPKNFELAKNLQGLWDDLSSKLHRLEENWEVWIDWYNDRLVGVENIDLTLQSKRISFEAEEYRYAAALNPKLKQVVADYKAKLALSKFQPQYGLIYEVSGQFLKPVYEAHNDDLAVTQDSAVQMLFEDIARKSVELRDSCRGIGQTHNWPLLEQASVRYSKLLENEFADIAPLIKLMYHYTVELATFLDRDRELLDMVEGNNLPLPSDTRRSLRSLILSAGPWLRKFPSARMEDDELGNFLQRPELYQSSRLVLETVKSVAILNDDDRQLLESLVIALNKKGMFSQRAGAQGYLGLRNLLAESAKVLGCIYLGATGSAISEDSVIVRKAAELFLRSEAQIIELMEDAPSDIRNATAIILEKIKDDRKSKTPTIKPLARGKNEEE